MEHSKRHIPPSWNFTSPIKDVFWIKNCTLQTLIPESFKNSILAGLLTYSIFLTPFPFLQSGTVDLSIVGKLLAELTAAGLFRIYTWFPFHHSFRRIGKVTPKFLGTKICKLAHIRMDFAGIMQTIGIKGRYVGFTYIRPLYGFAPFWRS